MTSVLDFGADPTGVNPSGMAFNNALATAQTIDAPNGSYKIDATVQVPENAHLRMEAGATLFPASNISVTRLHPGGKITGGLIDVTGVPNWWNGCIEINGDDEALPVKFRLDTPTIVRDIKFVGQKQFGGAGVYVRCDGASNARVMGLDIEFRCFGLEVPLYLKVGNNYGSQFITANRFSFMATESWRALLMSGGNGNDIAGNEIWYEHEPDYTSTCPSADIKGQMNRIYALPWDWNNVPGAPKAVILQQGSRNNWIDMPQLPQYFQNNSGYSSNTLRALV